MDDSGKLSPGRKRALAQENLLNFRKGEEEQNEEKEKEKKGKGEEKGFLTERPHGEETQKNSPEKDSDQGKKVMQKQGRRLTLTTETPKPAHLQTSKDLTSAKRGSSSNPKLDKTKSPGILKKFASSFTPTSPKAKDKPQPTLS